MGLRSGRTIRGDLIRAARNPGLAWSYVRRWALLARFAGLPYAEVRRFRRELIGDQSFQSHLERGLGEARGGFGRAAELYVVVRAAKPETMVETGVASGVSSAHILQAMAKNGKGTLHSVDLPNAAAGAQIPEGRGAGWIIPEALRSRWRLSLGDSREILPRVLDGLPAVDVFFHDSDHSYESMMLEFEAALPKVRSGGLILSDDTHYHRAWDDFCAKHALPPTRVVHMGLTKKP